MKKMIAFLLAALTVISATACSSTNEPDTTVASTTTGATANPDTTPTVDENDHFIGVKNPEKWTVEEGVDYSKYEFLGRGEELVKEIQEKYRNYTIKYIMDGSETTADKLNSVINVMADYSFDASASTLTVNIDTVKVRVHCDYSEITAASGSFVVIGFTTNLPTKFLVSIGNKADKWGEISQDAITPEGSNGTYKAKVKITVPYVEAGDYFLNFSIDSGNANYPYIMSVPFTITEGENADSEFKLLYAGDWDLITAEGYQESLTRLFYNSYPRIYKRFGMGSEPKTITFVADKGYDGVAYALGTQIVVSVDYANSNPWDIGFFSHEITHSAQQYGNQLNYGDDAWWTENMANYGGFRYFHWSSAEYVQVYKANDASLQDWGYQAYGNNKWFFAYMDAKYPTTKNEDGSLNYGLIDSINRMIKTHTGAQLNDDPYDTTSKFNLKVKEVTGFDCIESLRLSYVEELQNGTWAFEGFGDYTDNFLTEDLPNVENPDYPMITEPRHGNKTASAITAVTSGDNLVKDATIHSVSGQVNASEKAEYLIDGQKSTKWCSTGTSNAKYSLDGTLHWVIIDLGKTQDFNTYTIFNTKTVEPAYGNMTEWEILISDDAENWTSVDYQPSCNENSASFNVGDQSARYLMLRIYNPDESQVGTVRLYEFMLFDQ